jgi:hypothetical protein
MTRTALTGVRDAFLARVASEASALEKRIREALAIFGRPGVRKIAVRFGFDRDCLLISNYAVAPPGRRTVNTEPLPGSLVTVTSPPIMRASLRERARPSPVPP